MTRALAIVVVAACQGGLEIVVLPPSDQDPVMAKIDRVDLFVGLDSMGPVTIAPPPGNGVAPGYRGTAFKLDGNAAQSATTLPARFTLTRGDAAQIGVVVAVAYAAGVPVASILPYDGQGQPVVLSIPSSGVDTIRIGLDAADALPLGNPIGTHHERGQTWASAANAAPTCAFTESLDVGYHTFVVDELDVDCDGLRNADANECLPTVYQGTRGPRSLDDMTCVLPPTDAGGRCVIGGPPCTDGHGQSTDPLAPCTASPYCVPASVCAQCGFSNTSMQSLVALDACVTGMGPNLAAHATYVAAGMTITAGQFGACPGASAPAPFIALPMLQCRGGEARVYDDSRTSQPWQHALTINSVTLQFDVDDQCRLSVNQNGTSQDEFTRSTLLAVNLQNGTGIVVPLELKLSAATGCIGIPSVGLLMPAAISASLDSLANPARTGCLDVTPLPGASLQDF